MSLRSIIHLTGIVGAMCVGYGMWSVISPGLERRQEMIKNLPEANPIRMAETRMRTAQVMQILKEAAETKENIARSK